MVSSEPLLLPVSLEGEFSNSMKEMIGGCCVCSDERGWAENPLVYCDGHGCNVAVHQACYGIVQVPTGPWFCRKCESQERAARVNAVLTEHSAHTAGLISHLDFSPVEGVAGAGAPCGASHRRLEILDSAEIQMNTRSGASALARVSWNAVWRPKDCQCRVSLDHTVCITSAAFLQL